MSNMTPQQISNVHEEARQAFYDNQEKSANPYAAESEEALCWDEEYDRVELYEANK